MDQQGPSDKYLHKHLGYAYPLGALANMVIVP
jgi:hypothetical protein